MELNEYQKEAAKKSEYKNLETVGGLLYTTLDLSSKTGKFVNSIKNILEKKDGKINIDDKSELVKELGDILLCVSHIADELYITLDDVALLNIQKAQLEQSQTVSIDKNNQK